MTDLLLGSNNDLIIEDGKLLLVPTKEQLTRQRLLNKLRSFTGTLFTNINYGIDVSLVFEKGTKELLDQNIKSLIASTTGVIRLVEYTSSVSVSRVYTCKFKYEIETGEIVGISGLFVDATGSIPITTESGVWKNGYWDYSGIWNNEEVWGA